MLFGHGFSTQIIALITGMLAIGITFLVGGFKKEMPIFMMVLARSCDECVIPSVYIID
ncbi:hypothetical protein JCM19055_860 [Geomicrobium sp. JCM 19055]|nr:hypothetical protein JCM19055_860 [Geomicrobium sp. JCM 19055]